MKMLYSRIITSVIGYGNIAYGSAAEIQFKKHSNDIICKGKENISNIIITGRNWRNATSMKKLNCNYIFDRDKELITQQDN